MRNVILPLLLICAIVFGNHPDHPSRLHHPSQPHYPHYYPHPYGPSPYGFHWVYYPGFGWLLILN